MLNKTEISKRFKEIASQYRSKAEFARLIGLHPQSLYAYFDGKKTPGLKLLEKMKNAGIDTDYVLYGIQANEVKPNQKIDEPENQDTPQTRLSKFIYENFKYKKDFCSYLGINETDLAKYINKGTNVFKRPDKIEKLKMAGLDIDWYYYGKLKKSNNSNISDVIDFELVELPDIKTLNINQMNEVYQQLKDYLDKLNSILEVVEED